MLTAVSLIFFALLTLTVKYRKAAVVLCIYYAVLTIHQFDIPMALAFDCLVGIILVHCPYGLRQIPLLLASIAITGLLESDLLFHNNLVYTSYGPLINAIIVLQMIVFIDGFHDGIYILLRRISGLNKFIHLFFTTFRGDVCKDSTERRKPQGSRSLQV